MLLISGSDCRKYISQSSKLYIYILKLHEGHESYRVRTQLIKLNLESKTYKSDTYRKGIKVITSP